MIGFFLIKSFGDNKDLQGFATSASVVSDMDERIEGNLLLPPYLRAGQCNIQIGSKVFAVMDDTTGFGVALYGVDGADFGYFFDADINIKKNLTVNDSITATKDIKSKTGDITATLGDISTGSGDVKAKSFSLSTHTHAFIGIPEGVPGTTATPNPSI